jgi:predicted transposase YdaD
LNDLTFTQILGFCKFFVEGKFEGKLEVAGNLLARGMSISTIAEVTGLSENEIMIIQSSHGE